ncbi:hypothetical protein CR513_14104, partial [Mucuna pruriens]
MVMVKKANGNMCTDYTDLNKAYQKNRYPLPSIDWLVDGASGFALLGFMDAYSGYNQIKMYPRDEANIAFIMDAWAYYYKVIPFGLKNVGATYQRLMDKIFQGLIGGDVEVYVDDMVVKFAAAVDHYRALGRVFQMLRRHQLKLNPEKCSFGVQAGKFLRFMLTERGFEANQEKCRAIINMRSSWTGQGGAATDQEDHNTLTIPIPISGDGCPHIQHPQKRRLVSETKEAFLRLKALLADKRAFSRLTHLN